jgi:uncharacterized protein YceK
MAAICGVLLAMISLLVGCGTLVNVAGGGEGTPYGGTKFDAAACSAGLAAGVGPSLPDQKFDPPTSLGLGCYALVDLPFSIVADTLTLPITLTRQEQPWKKPSGEDSSPERR